MKISMTPVARAMDAALASLQEAGVDIVEIEVPEVRERARYLPGSAARRVGCRAGDATASKKAGPGWTPWSPSAPRPGSN